VTRTPAPLEAERAAAPVTERWDLAPCGLLSVRDDGIIVAANLTLLTMTEQLGEQLPGRSVDTLFTIPSRIFYQTHVFPMVKLHGRADELYMTLRTRSGAPVPVLVNAIRRELDGGAEVDFAILRIREREKYELELIRAKKAFEAASAAKSRFLSMMSHDLRTPLGAISGYAELISLGVRGPVTDEQATDLSRIKRAATTLLGMLDDLLTVAREQDAQLPLRLEPLSPAAELSEAEATVLPRYTEAGVRLVRDSCSPEIVVRADRDRLQRILLNLLTNAAKFTPNGGQVTVGCSVVADRAAIHVADTGRGIPPEMLDRIFQPFVQVESGDAGNEHGMGLGLAIGRELARAMGGDLSVESAVGRGSIFTLTLPTAASSGA
jgi:signal transduction histidine kinase